MMALLILSGQSHFLFPGAKVQIRALLFLITGLWFQAAVQYLPQAMQNQRQTERWILMLSNTS